MPDRYLTEIQTQTELGFSDCTTGAYNDATKDVRLGKFVGQNYQSGGNLQAQRRGRELLLGGILNVSVANFSSGYPFIRLPALWVGSGSAGNQPGTQPLLYGSIHREGNSMASFLFATYLNTWTDEGNGEAAGWVEGLAGYFSTPIFKSDGTFFAPLSTDDVIIWPGISTSFILPVNPDA